MLLSVKNPAFRLLLLVCLAGMAWAAEPVSEPAAEQATGPDRAEGAGRDVLVYQDGDRVHGRLVEQKDGTVVFDSGRFGVLRVPAANVVVIKAEKPAASTPTVADAKRLPAAQLEKQAAEHQEAEQVTSWEKFSPAVLASRLRDYFGPWTGRLAFSTELVSDTTDRSNLSFETRLRRKWKVDEILINARYDYSKTNDVASSDLLKADGLLRHDFPKGAFVLYHPNLEWNRANYVSGVPADYVLLQQEIGVGANLLSSPARKLRIGVSENLFKVWNTTAPETDKFSTSQAAFLETELRLPWGLLLTDRGVYYYSFAEKGDGWENRIELTKKFTEALSTAIRQEIREGGPGKTVQDYSRLKLLFGLDF